MKRGSIARTITVFFAFVLFIGLSDASPAQPRPVKTGILLVAFGTGVPEAQKAYDHIERMVRAAFPETPVRWAYTSSMIRAKLARQGKPLDSMEAALARMMDERFTHVAVQSLHVIAGWEFHEMQRNADAFGAMTSGFDRITVGGPLLASAEDFTRVTQALLNRLPPGRKPQEAVVFMGHGTSHPSNAGYAALMYHLQRRDPGVFMGTVEESPTIEEIRDTLVLRKVSKAYLMPFMAVAGDHARNDLAGEGEGSWKNILARAGIKCTPVLAGVAEYDEIGMIWVEHLKTAVARLDSRP